MMLFLYIRCDDCRVLFQVRRPKNTLLIPQIVALVKCPTCHPEALVGMCAGCRLPLALVRPGKKWGSSGFPADQCFTCYQRGRRGRIAFTRTFVQATLFRKDR